VVRPGAEAGAVERLFAFRADHMVGLLRVADGRIAHRLPGHTAPVRVLIFQEEGRN
jgi:hypothetical protein